MFLDFLTGAATVLLIVLLVPFLWFVFHVSFLVAIPIAVAVGLFFGLVVIGKLIRFTAGRYRESRENRRTHP